MSWVLCQDLFSLKTCLVSRRAKTLGMYCVKTCPASCVKTCLVLRHVLRKTCQVCPSFQCHSVSHTSAVWVKVGEVKFSDMSLLLKEETLTSGVCAKPLSKQI